MKTVILCGGAGTRLRELTNEIPKGLVEIGGRPILWHIMKIYAHFGFNEFVLCLGYKGDKIVDYFRKNPEMDWQINFLDTGIDTNTGGRLKQTERLINGETFMATYGDGLANINLRELLNFHHSHNKIATISTTQPQYGLGVLDIDKNNLITKFEEKPLLNFWINGGFFVFNQNVFNYLPKDEVLEKRPFERLVEDQEVCAFKHSEFWACLDTYKDNVVLNEAWKNNSASWKIWD